MDDRILAEPGKVVDLFVKNEEIVATILGLPGRLGGDKRVMDVTYPERDGWFRSNFFPTKCANWLAKHAGVEVSDAQLMIDGFPVDVHPELKRNPMNPRAFLGIAAALAKKPDVIVYQTGGMDPMGVTMLGEYLEENLGAMSAVHVTWEFEG